MLIPLESYTAALLSSRWDGGLLHQDELPNFNRDDEVPVE